MSTFTVPNPLYLHIEQLSTQLGPLTPRDPSDPIFQLPAPNPPTRLTPIVARVREYIAEKVPAFIVNHSYRCWAWGVLVASRFGWDTPDHGWDSELYLLTALLHDVGCAKECTENKECRLSFEIWGGIKARELLLELGASQTEADEVCEAIVRHTEEYETGRVRLIPALMQLSPSQDFRAILTPGFIHQEDVNTVCTLYPRLNMEVGFTGAFGSEVMSKPGCWTSRWFAGSYQVADPFRGL